MKNVSFQLEQLTCPSCIRKIENTLNKTAGVEKAAVLFNSSKVKAQYDEAKIDAEQIEKVIRNLGYPVLSVQS